MILEIVQFCMAVETRKLEEYLLVAYGLVSADICMSYDIQIHLRSIRPFTQLDWFVTKIDRVNLATFPSCLHRGRAASFRKLTKAGNVTGMLALRALQASGRALISVCEDGLECGTAATAHRSLIPSIWPYIAVSGNYGFLTWSGCFHGKYTVDAPHAAPSLWSRVYRSSHHCSQPLHWEAKYMLNCTVRCRQPIRQEVN